MAVSSIRAFSDPQYDYYELQQDLGGVVPKGAIFYHDENDDTYGSISEGCLKLCWTPNGDTYRLCGGTIVLHASFTKSPMFKKVCSKVSEDELRELITPVYKWLQENYDPHTRVVIGYDFVSVVRDEQGMPLRGED